MNEPTCGHADDEIWGACAEVFIASDLDVHSLAQHIASKLICVNFQFETGPNPHVTQAVAEVLGCELHVAPSSDLEGFNYRFSVWTSHAGSLIPRDRMFNLSPWLARYLRDIADLKASPAEDEVTGARARAYLSSDLDLATLAGHLSQLLHIELELDTDMDPPHEWFATTCALGFDIVLDHSSDVEGFNYSFDMYTMHSFDANVAGRMVDLSHWLESYLQLIGHLTVAPLSCSSPGPR